MSKLTEDPLLDDANQIFYSATKNAKFMLLETLRWALSAPNILWLLPPPPPRKTISVETKSVFILILVKSFRYQSFRQNYFGCEIEWVVFTETGP